jgi:YHS domain-containing protein
MNISKFLLAASLLTLPIVDTVAHAAPTQSVHERFDTLGLGVALGGFDPVAYFPEGGGKPAKGFVKRDYKHGGVTYRFASDANLARFRANPEKYVPAYNGWCAWAMAELNAKVDVEPTAYEVYNGKLYVFYDHADLNTREMWLKNPQAMVAKADANWKALGK